MVVDYPPMSSVNFEVAGFCRQISELWPASTVVLQENSLQSF